MTAFSPLYSFYESRLRASLDASRLPRHIAVMADGNRRWAREAGFTDVTHGYRAGATKISELLGWCDELGVDVATIYLLSTENLSRDATELEELLGVIADVVDEITGPDRNWEVRIVGKPDMLPEPIATRLRAAEKASAGRPGCKVNVAIGYGGRHEIADAARELVAQLIDEGKTGRELVEGSGSDAALGLGVLARPGGDRRAPPRGPARPAVRPAGPLPRAGRGRGSRGCRTP